MTLPIVATEFWVATEPTMRFMEGSGLAVCEFRIKASERKLNKQTNEWEDGKTLWANAHVWSSNNKPMAENTYESIKKGDTVVLDGRIYVRQYQDKDQNPRLSVDVDVNNIGPALAFRSTPHGNTASGGAGQGGSGAQQQAVGATTQSGGSEASQGQQDGAPYPF